MEMRTIVVGVDKNPASRDAMAWAANEAVMRDAVLVVVHAWNVPASVFGAVGAYGAMPSMLGHADIYESAAAETMRAAVGSVDVNRLPHGIVERLVRGDAASAILDAATPDADLIVVGSRRRSGLGELLLGSTSREVARNATVPVVVVPVLETAAA
jgi:nucleotide-binding universal stress UspA family protein